MPVPISASDEGNVSGIAAGPQKVPPPPPPPPSTKSIVSSDHFNAADQATTPSGPPPPPPPPPPVTKGFRGTFSFGVHAGDTDLSSYPAIQGVLGYYKWSDVEAAPNSLDIARIRADMKPWTDFGKQFAVRIMGGYPNSTAVPSWLHVPMVSTYPVYWNSTYLAATQALANQLAAAFDGDPSVSWIQIGLGVYGESKVEQVNGPSKDLGAWTAQGYSDQVWLNCMSTILGYYKSAFKRTPLVAAVNASFIGGSGMHGADVVAVLDRMGIMPQEDGWRAGYTLSPSWQGHVGGVMEQYLSSAGSGSNSAEGDLKSIVQTAPAMPGGLFALIYPSDLRILISDGQKTLEWAQSQIGK